MLSVSLTIPLLPLASTKTRSSSDQSFLHKQYALNNQSFSRPGSLVLEELRRRRSCECRNRGRNNHIKFDDDGEDFIVVNFYRFVSIEDPEAEIEKHLSFLKDLNIRGRIYLNEQGINAQYSGPSKDALAYVEWLKEDDRFSDLLVQISPAINGHAFPKLKLQNKPSLVQYEGGISHLPLLDPPMRAKPLEPSEWKRKLNDLTDGDEASTSGRSCILLDVRNGFEWDVGHFRGAPRPEVDCFRNTSFGLSDEKEAPSDPLINVDKEKTDILMYCTGGIRCDVYSAVLSQISFQTTGFQEPVYTEGWSFPLS
ncbi:PREDICTED: rhodanese-like domain-containing protein 8, chloroplastic isoform X3 [Camelina sativa]|uniref:Rhodanese-like domain-containing protein 8, chloroplastic isoform X3 n=1 Tax=Camelina sativa TaxID=90675 RepID=A0ABM1R7T7_CAMSA|nr:PREDICTED: rhodanese-like domain-containing protein 8, chloroplastic isoform X3 [Camelina sativa]